MSWFRRKFKNWFYADENYGAVKAVSISEDSLASEASINFRIYNATGGHVMEFRKYDTRSDRTNTQIYVISKDEDVGERVARIVNLEMLK